MIPQRSLGAAGFAAPILGLGVSGPHGLGLADTKALVRQAYEAGGALFDTAPFYGDAEARLGAALAELDRARCILITKAGTVRRAGRVEKDFSPAGLEGALIKSLKDLCCDHVDLFLLHGPAPEHLTDELAAALDSFRRRGLIRASGICGRGPALAAAFSFSACQVIQAPVWERYDGQPWSARAAATGLGFIGIEALRATASGWRWPARPADLWYLARALRQRAPRSDRASPATRLTEALNFPGVSSVLVATTRPAHLAENLAAASQLPV